MEQTPRASTSRVAPRRVCGRLSPSRRNLEKGGRRRPSLRAYCQQIGNVLALLFRYGGNTRQGLSVAPGCMGGVADDEYVRVPWPRKIGCDFHASRAIHVGTEPISGRRCHDAGGPHGRANALDAELAERAKRRI